MDQRDQIVTGVIAYAAIKASDTTSLRNDVPQSNVMLEQRIKTSRIVQADEISLYYLADQGPKFVLRMPVILTLGQRHLSRQAAQYQYPCAGIHHRRETTFERHAPHLLPQAMICVETMIGPAAV